MKTHSITSSKKSFIALPIFMSLAFLTACSNPAVIPTATLAPTITATSTPTATFTPTITPSPTTTTTPTSEPPFVLLNNDALQLYYPKELEITESDCPSDFSTCLIELADPDSDTLAIQLIIQSSPTEQPDLKKRDEFGWNLRKIGGTTPGFEHLFKLISVAEIEIDGIKAIKRLYQFPQVDMATEKVTETQYNYYVVFFDEKYSYSFGLQTSNVEEFPRYTEIADQMVSTITFHK